MRATNRIAAKQAVGHGVGAPPRAREGGQHRSCQPPRILPGGELFFSHVHLLGGPAPVRRVLPELIDLIWNRQIDPGKVVDLTLPLGQAAEGYQAMDERRAIKALLQP